MEGRCWTRGNKYLSILIINQNITFTHRTCEISFVGWWKWTRPCACGPQRLQFCFSFFSWWLELQELGSMRRSFSWNVQQYLFSGTASGASMFTSYNKGVFWKRLERISFYYFSLLPVVFNNFFIFGVFGSIIRKKRILWNLVFEILSTHNHLFVLVQNSKRDLDSCRQSRKRLIMLNLWILVYDNFSALTTRLS
jgi:hypothetical protein